MIIATRQADVREGRHVPAARYTQWTTPDGQTKIRQWVADGLNDKQIADRIGIDKSLLSSWRRKYKDIRDALTRPMVTDSGDIVDKHEVYKGGVRKLTNVERVQTIVDAYVRECKEQDKPMTRPGLALALGIDGETLTRYVGESTGRDARPSSDLDGEIRLITVGDILKKAVITIEDDLAQRAIARNSAGAMFALKNWYGYADKQETTVVNDVRHSLNDEQLDSRIQALLAKAASK